MEVPIDNVVATILYDPVPAVGEQHAPGIGLLGRLTGDAKRMLDGERCAFLVLSQEEKRA